MASVSVRSFTEADVDAAGLISNAMQPPHLAAEDRMTRWQDIYRVAKERFCPVAESIEERVVIGCGSLWHVRPQKFRLDLMVHPNWQRHGIGEQLLERLMAEAQRRDATTVQARARDDRSDTLEFLRKRGFVESQRMHNFGVEPNSVDRSTLRTALRRAKGKAIVLTTLAAERRTDPDCLPKLYALYLVVLPDWPDPDPGSAELPSFDEFLRRLEEAGGARGGFVLAKSGEHLVGFCDGLATGVHPAHRGRGIATAMEARGIQHAIRRGWQGIITNTANPAMGAVYEKLGYRRRFSEVRLVRRLETE